MRVTLHGALDLAHRDRLASVLRTAVTSGHAVVEADFAEVTQVEAGVIAVFVDCARVAREHGCVLRVVNATGVPALVLDLSGAGEALGHLPRRVREGGRP
jgi:ABC-type transporter Mla MlaB component